MNCILEHIGYITDDIAKTTESFLLLGYEAGPIVDDEIQPGIDPMGLRDDLL